MLHKSLCKSTYENIPLNRLGRRREARASSPAAIRWTLSRKRVWRRLRRPWAVSDVPCSWNRKPAARLAAARCPTPARETCLPPFSPRSGQRWSDMSCSSFVSRYRPVATEDQRRRNRLEYWSHSERAVDRPETPGGRKPTIVGSFDQGANSVLKNIYENRTVARKKA